MATPYKASQWQVELAAEVGDAWFADPITPLALLKQSLADYKAVLPRKGKSFESLEFPLMREVYCAKTDEQAWEEARDPVLYIYREYPEWGHMQDEFGIPVAPGDERALDLLRQRFIIGRPETCIRECRKYRAELGVTNLVARMKFPGLEHERVLNNEIRTFFWKFIHKLRNPRFVIELFALVGMIVYAIAAHNANTLAREQIQATQKPYVSIGGKDGTIGTLTPTSNGRYDVELLFSNGGPVAGLNFNVSIPPKYMATHQK
jgi:hypothetical protein